MKRIVIFLVSLLILFPMTAFAHEPLDWMDDVKILVKGPGDEPSMKGPFARIRMHTDDGEKYAYFLLDQKCIETFKSDKKMLRGDVLQTVGTIGVSYSLGEKDEYGYYIYDESAPESLVKFAERKCGYRAATQRSRKEEIIIAHLEAKSLTDGVTIAVQTVTAKDELARLQKVFKNAKYGYEGKCPYTGVLTLVYADGTAERMYKATDSCDGIIVGSCTPIDLGKKGNEEFWSVFDQVWTAVMN